MVRPIRLWLLLLVVAVTLLWVWIAYAAPRKDTLAADK